MKQPLDKTVATDAQHSGQERLWLAGAIKRVLSKHLGDEREHTAWLSQTLGVERSGVWRKLHGKTTWSDVDLLAVAARLDMSMESLLIEMVDRGKLADQEYCEEANERVHARVQISGLEKDVDMEVGAQCDGSKPDIVAIERSGNWYCIQAKELREGEIGRMVKSLSLQSQWQTRIRVALLDDEPMVTEGAKEQLELHGIDSECFAQVAELQGAIAKNEFDAFVIDWLIMESTSEEVVRSVRESQGGRNKPIVIVTGQIKTGRASEDELARVAQRYGCWTKEKPVRWGLISAELTAAIRQAER